MKPNRTGIWIPVWIEELRLSHSQTKLLAEIVSLHEKGSCFASNQYFSEVLGLKVDTVSRLISELKKKGIIQQTGFDGRRRTLAPILKSSKTEALEKSPMLTTQSSQSIQVRPSEKSKAASAFFPSPICTLEVQKKVHNSWEQFLDWSRGKVSPSTWTSLRACQRPTELTGLAKVYWTRWSGMHLQT